MKPRAKSGPQGISGKNVKIGELYSTGGKQTVSAKGYVEVKRIDNRIKKPKNLPFSNIKIKDFTLLHLSASAIDSVIGSLLGIFKK